MTEYGSPKLSVCVATYNGHRHVREQISSILFQLGSDDEVVISDDWSSDDTADIIRSFGDQRIKFIMNNGKRGVISNFENSMRNASKDVIVLSDQDDIWLDNKVRVVRGKFLSYGDVYKVIMMDGYLVNEKGSPLGMTVFEKLRPRPGLLKNIFRNCYMGSCMAFSRSLLEVALPIPANVPMHDSWIGLLGEIFADDVEFLAEKTIKRRIHPENASLKKNRFKTRFKHRLTLALCLAKRCTERKWKT